MADLTVREAAKWLGVSVPTIYALCGAGLLGHYRMGLNNGRIFVTEEDAKKYRDSCRREVGDVPAESRRKVVHQSNGRKWLGNLKDHYATPPKSKK
jgi:excisionase family DNA binding protein